MRTKAPTNQSFFLPGGCKDPAYRNVRDNPQNKPYLTEGKAFVESLWIRYRDSKVKDPRCRENAPNHFLAWFWEMYLAVTLQERGFKLERYGNTGPEFYFLHQGHKVWVEAVAPGPGEKEEDRVPGYRNGELAHIPEEKVLLRFTNALDEKRKKYKEALEKNIIASDDLYILAINSRGIPHGWDGDILPYFVKAFIALGTPEVDTKNWEFSFERRPTVKKASGQTIPTNAGIDPAFSFISAVLHSGVD